MRLSKKLNDICEAALGRGKNKPLAKKYEFKIEKLNSEGDYRISSGNEVSSDLYVPEGENLQDVITDYINDEFLYDFDDNEAISTEISDYYYDEKFGEGSFTARLFCNDLNETYSYINDYSDILEQVEAKTGSGFTLDRLANNTYELAARRMSGIYQNAFVICKEKDLEPLKSMTDVREQQRYLLDLVKRDNDKKKQKKE